VFANRISWRKITITLPTEVTAVSTTNPICRFSTQHNKCTSGKKKIVTLNVIKKFCMQARTILTNIGPNPTRQARPVRKPAEMGAADYSWHTRNEYRKRVYSNWNWSFLDDQHTGVAVLGRNLCLSRFCPDAWETEHDRESLSPVKMPFRQTVFTLQQSAL